MECRLRVFENRVLKRDKVTGEWRKLYNKELYYPYSSPNIIRVIIPKRQRLAGHVAHICRYCFCCHLLGFITRVLLCSYYYNLIIILVRWNNVHVDIYLLCTFLMCMTICTLYCFYLWLFPHPMKFVSIWIYEKWINWTELKIRDSGGACKVFMRKLEGRNHLEDPGVNGRIVLKWIFEKWDGGCMDWIDLAQDRGKWRVLVNAIMNLRVP